MSKAEVLSKLSLPDAFAGFVPLPDSIRWGWNGESPIFAKLIERTRPALIIEAGAWLGLSTVTMARELERVSPGSALVTIDTWLGSQEHWQEPNLRPYLELEHGYPTLYRRFASNVVEAGCAKTIIPLPMPSLIAARLLDTAGIEAELIYIDGSHDETDVYADLNAFWPLLKPGGVMFGDDWVYGALAQAVEHFCAGRQLRVGLDSSNWIITKP